jgi:hypothetical protein
MGDKEGRTARGRRALSKPRASPERILSCILHLGSRIGLNDRDRKLSKNTQEEDFR